MVKEKKGHIIQASIKLLWRGQHQCVLFLCFSFLFNQEEKPEAEGKSTLLSFVKALCVQLSALQIFITSLGEEGLRASVTQVVV